MKSDIKQKSPKRKSISKKRRFEIFKRDGFVCGYCGAHPPAVVLHLDHIIPIKDGGDNSDYNLITACEGCNLGKAANALNVIPQSLNDRKKEIEERERQLAGYRETIQSQKERIESDINAIDSVFQEYRPGYCFSESARRSVRQFLKMLEPDEIINALDIAYNRLEDPEAFRYFCGICWRKIREIEE